MKAMRIHSFGASQVLRCEEVSIPRPGPGEVLVRVHAAGVNPIDYKIRSGSYRRPVSLPVTLGREISGVVEQAGSGVEDLRPGDDVYGMLGTYSGGYAEYALALRRELALKPESLDHIHAAAVPLAATTAWQGLFDHGKLQSGETVLIHGGAGGVGHFAIQFAGLRGTQVLATAREEDLDFVRGLGADLAIDYENERFENRVHGVDLVLDLVGGQTQERSWQVLHPGGRLVSSLGMPPGERAAERRVTALGFMAEPRSEQLAEIAGLIDAGRVEVVVERILPLPEAARAQDELEHEHIRGKVVLTAG